MAGKHTKRIQECKRNDKEFDLETSETFFFSLDSHPITVGYFFKINDVKAQKKKKNQFTPLRDTGGILHMSMYFYTILIQICTFKKDENLLCCI